MGQNQAPVSWVLCSESRQAATKKSAGLHSRLETYWEGIASQLIQVVGGTRLP